MDKEKFDLRSEYITKAAQARVAMWSAVGNVFGFIIAAESIVSAVSVPVWWLLLPILGSSFSGVLLLVWCFKLMHRDYVGIADDLSKSVQHTDEQKIAAALTDEQRPDYISGCERWAIWLLWFSAACFIIQAVKICDFFIPAHP